MHFIFLSALSALPPPHPHRTAPMLCEKAQQKKKKKEKFHLSKTDIAKCNAHCSNNGRENPFPSRFSLRRYSNFEFFFIFIPIFVVVLRKFSLRKKEGNFVYTFLGLVAGVGKREKFVVCSPPSRFRNTLFFNVESCSALATSSLARVVHSLVVSYRSAKKREREREKM